MSRARLPVAAAALLAVMAVVVGGAGALHRVAGNNFNTDSNFKFKGQRHQRV